PANTWVLKGDASIAGTTDGTNTVFLAATETGASNNNGGATIHAGTNGVGVTDNANVDNAIVATATVGTTTGVPVFEDTTLATPIFTSNPPVFITMASLDINGARMRGFSNKVFTHFGYSWTDRERWVPYVGVG